MRGRVVIRAVLFDLDDTLLDINLTAFVARWASGKARILAKASGIPYPIVMERLARSYMRVNDQSRDDQMTNEQLLNETFFSPSPWTTRPSRTPSASTSASASSPSRAAS